MDVPSHSLNASSLHPRASLVAQVVKNAPAVQETLVQILGWEDPLEAGMATYSSILAPIDRRAWWATLHGESPHLLEPYVHL